MHAPIPRLLTLACGAVLLPASAIAAQALPVRPAVAIGHPAPGAPGTFFHYLQEATTNGSAIAVRGGLAVPGDRTAKTRSVKEGGRGLWVADASGLRLVALEDQPAPGLSYAVFDQFPSFALGPAGHLAFVANLKPTQVASDRRKGKLRDDPAHPMPSGTRQALYLIEPGKEPRLLMRAGDPVPGQAGHEWGRFDLSAAVPAVSRSGRLAIHALTTVAASLETPGYWMFDQGSVTLLAARGEKWEGIFGAGPAPGPTVTAAGAVLFGATGKADRQPVIVRAAESAATLGGGLLTRVFRIAATDAGEPICLAQTKQTQPGHLSIVRLGADSAEEIVSVGTPIQGLPSEARVVGLTQVWSVAGDGTALILAQGESDGRRVDGMLMARHGVVAALATTDASAPGTEASVLFDAFDGSALACNRRGQAVFFGTTRQSSLRGDPTLASRGLYAWNGRQCVLVARVGGQFDIGGGRLRRVIALDLVGPTPLGDDGTVRVAVTWELAGDEPKEAALDNSDGRSHGIYVVHLGEPAPAIAPELEKPANPSPATAAPPPPRKQPEPPPAAPPAAPPTAPAALRGRLQLPVALYRDAAPDAAAVRAACKAAHAARDAAHRRPLPFSFDRLHLRREIYDTIAKTMESWEPSERQLAQRQERLRQMLALGPSRSTAALERQIAEQTKTLAESKARFLDVQVVRGAVAGHMLSRFLIDAEAAAVPPARGPRSRGGKADHNRLVADMEDVRDSITPRFTAANTSTEDRATLQLLNECCQQIIGHSRAGEPEQAQKICDAVVAWILDDSATLPGLQSP